MLWCRPLRPAILSVFMLSPSCPKARLNGKVAAVNIDMRNRTRCPGWTYGHVRYESAPRPGEKGFLQDDLAYDAEGQPQLSQPDWERGNCYITAGYQSSRMRHFHKKIPSMSGYRTLRRGRQYGSSASIVRFLRVLTALVKPASRTSIGVVGLKLP